MTNKKFVIIINANLRKETTQMRQYSYNMMDMMMCMAMGMCMCGCAQNLGSSDFISV